MYLAWLFAALMVFAMLCLASAGLRMFQEGEPFDVWDAEEDESE